MAMMKKTPAKKMQMGGMANTTPMMKKGGMAKAKSGGSFAALAPPYDKATFADKIAGAKKNAGKAKNGAAMKKMQYGGDAASMVPPMKSGGKMKKAMMGSSMMAKPMMKSGGKAKKAGMHKMPDGSMMKNSMMKSGGKMGKCKYGCN